MDRFAHIRPYQDQEVNAVLNTVIRDKKFLDVITQLQFQNLPVWCKPLLHWGLKSRLKRQVRKLHTVRDFQQLFESYLNRILTDSTDSFMVSGLDTLASHQPYLYLSNHRDIALDPALVNLALHWQGRDTVRIAIGDNLLTEDFISKLMRLNKSFIVKRSVTKPRELLKELKLLSEYIHESLAQKQSVWLAQREGRAKDGIDATDSAIIKMLCIANKKQPLADIIRELNIVPVAISYEYDPCDALKASELHAIETKGAYQKQDGEDIRSIAQGITGYKGKVYLRFGHTLDGDFETIDDVVSTLDQAIASLFVLQPSHYFAYEHLFGEYPDGGVYGPDDRVFDPSDFVKERAVFDERLENIESAHRPYVLRAYANPLLRKRELGN